MSLPLTQQQLSTLARTGSVTFTVPNSSPGSASRTSDLTTTSGGVTITLTQVSATLITYSASNGAHGTLTFSSVPASNGTTTKSVTISGTDATGKSASTTELLSYLPTAPPSQNAATRSQPIIVAGSSRAPMISSCDPNSDPTVEDDQINVASAEVQYAAAVGTLLATGLYGIAVDVASLGTLAPATLLGLGIAGLGVLSTGYNLYNARRIYENDWRAAEGRAQKGGGCK